MKNVFALSLSLICFTSVVAQKIIEKNFAYKNQSIDLDVKFARSIEVKTWEKNTVYFKADIKIERSELLDTYRIDFNENASSITITSEAEPVFKAYREICLKENKEDKRYCYNTGDKVRFTYTLYVPKNATFKVSSINGDLTSENIEGSLTADLINGDIDIATYSGDLDLSTINGEIDLKVGNASLVAETIHGDIYADEKLDLISEDRHVGRKVEKRLANTSKRLKLNTINGNMYLRL